MTVDDELQRLVSEVSKHGAQVDRIPVHPARFPMVMELLQIGFFVGHIERDGDGNATLVLERSGETELL